MTETRTKLNWFSIFRVLFGCLIMFGAFRFFYNGWIDSLYVAPHYHFSFPFFRWVRVMPAVVMYFLFGLMMVCGFSIALSVFYRPACLVFFVVFTYIELIDVTYYLNHYYLVSLLSFMMIFYDPKQSSQTLYNQRIIFFLKLQLSIVYFFGGINKLETDWLLHAQPLKIWLFTHSDIPVIGSLLGSATVAFIASWVSMLFDIIVPFALWFRNSRLVAYVILCIFHLLTAMLFNIGIFPWVMMIAALLFFEDGMSVKDILGGVSGIRVASQRETQKAFLRRLRNPGTVSHTLSQAINKSSFFILCCVAVWQLVFPLRHLLYPGNYLWTEQGFRFSWNIMLMEKNGSAEFGVQYANGKIEDVDELKWLTPFQQKMMSTQPDLIQQFAQLIKNTAEKNGRQVKAVFAESHVSLNGRSSVLYFDPRLNLITSEHELLQNIIDHTTGR